MSRRSYYQEFKINGIFSIFEGDSEGIHPEFEYLIWKELSPFLEEALKITFPSAVHQQTFDDIDEEKLSEDDLDEEKLSEDDLKMLAFLTRGKIVVIFGEKIFDFVPYSNMETSNKDLWDVSESFLKTLNQNGFLPCKEIWVKYDGNRFSRM
jgi:hypothetical protein